MTDTTVDEPANAGETPDAEGAEHGELEPAEGATPEAAAAEAARLARREALQTRFLVPLLVPVLALVAVAFYTLNVSRVFLAGDSDSALVIATLITITILVGGTIFAGLPKLRSSSLALVLGLVIVIVMSTGLVALGPSIDTGKSGGSTSLAQPAGAATSTVSVEALPTIRYNSTTFSTKAGIVEIDFSGATGHTLQFRKLDYKGFPLGTIGGFPASGKVELKPGDYEIFCTVDSHAAQGMTATITVT